MPTFRAIGLKWEGTFSEIVPDLKHKIQKVENHADELKNKAHPDIQLGLSYDVIENGFAHYAVYEVSDEQEIPEGVIGIRVPEWTYVKTAHLKGENVQKTFADLQQWLFDSKYTALRKAGVDYYDPYMSIKHEYYPFDQDPDNPHFDIYIPVVKK